MNLVYKIVAEKQAPIPTTYSKELGALVEVMLQKDPDKRPYVADVLKYPIIKKKMSEFVKNRGVNIPVHRRPTF